MHSWLFAKSRNIVQCLQTGTLSEGLDGNEETSSAQRGSCGVGSQLHDVRLCSMTSADACTQADCKAAQLHRYYDAV
jgi:hypothetical protein